jgi:hypothetical protein
MGTLCLKPWNLSNWSYQAHLPWPSTMLVWSLFLSTSVLIVYLAYVYKWVHYFNRSHSFALFLYNTIATKSVKKAYDALLLDAGGTLLQLTKPIEETYASIRRKYVFFLLFMLLLLLFTLGIICYLWIRMKWFGIGDSTLNSLIKSVFPGSLLQLTQRSEIDRLNQFWFLI